MPSGRRVLSLLLVLATGCTPSLDAPASAAAALSQTQVEFVGESPFGAGPVQWALEFPYEVARGDDGATSLEFFAVTGDEWQRGEDLIHVTWQPAP